MALQSSYTSKQGFTAPAAYSRIDKFFGSKSHVRVIVQVYYDQAAASLNKLPIGVESAEFYLANGPTMTELYTALKTDKRWANATDV